MCIVHTLYVMRHTINRLRNETRLVNDVITSAAHAKERCVDELSPSEHHAYSVLTLPLRICTYHGKLIYRLLVKRHALLPRYHQAKALVTDSIPLLASLL